MVNVLVDANFTIIGRFTPPLTIDLEESNATLKNLLLLIQEMVPHINVLNNSEFGDDIEDILLNGTSIFTIPDPLSVSLKAGDAIYIRFTNAPLGGG